MKILVTGGAGFIGSNLCEKLINDNEVFSLDNYSIGLKKNHIDGVHYFEGDILDISKIIPNDFDVCFHLAGLSRIQPSFKDPYNTFLANTHGVITVIEWCRLNNTKLIYSIDCTTRGVTRLLIVNILKFFFCFFFYLFVQCC